MVGEEIITRFHRVRRARRRRLLHAGASAPLPRTLLAVTLIALISFGGAPASASADELRLVERERLDPRLTELSFETPAVEGPTHVRVLLPDGYRGSGRRYPVLYLLHGCCNGTEGYRVWTDRLGAAEATAGKPVIVVMPDSGPEGGYVDWFNGGAGGPPMWETYHLGELVPWIDRRYRTVRRTGRAVAGLSMGGHGALAYAARHPDDFVAAAAFSGAVDLTVTIPLQVAFGIPFDPRPYGPYDTEEVRVRADNPADLAPNLRGLELALRTGNGENAQGAVVDPVEAGVHLASVSMHDRLEALGIAHVWDDYGAGTHSDEFWARDLRQTLPQILKAFRDPPRQPRKVAFKAAEPRYEVFGWRVRVRRDATEFSQLSAARRGGFKLTGSGTAKVVTPPRYDPDDRYLVVVRGEDGSERLELRPSRSGRLRIPIVLGPPNPLQQFTPAERDSPSTFFESTVRIRRVR